MRHDFAKDGAQRARAERVVVGNGKMVLAASLRGKASVGTNLSRELIAEGSVQRQDPEAAS